MVPEDAQHTLEAALQFVRENPQHDLNPGYRRVIYERMGELLSPGEIESLATDMQGYKRRMSLALGTTRHILPQWNVAGSVNQLPVEWLALAEQVYQRTIAHQLTVKERDELSQEILPDLSYYMQEIYRSTRDPLVGFGYAAFMSLTVAFFDHICLLVQPNEGEFFPILDLRTREEEVHYAYKDVAAWAAMAASDGLAEWPESNAEKRLAFWEWWLTEAVPSAWAAVPDELKG